ncbi:FecR domain-containing protein [Pseudomonas ovata]|uniref:FecR domain-containing protein n=1 Tax=Pseudomonas ovata TaxID=1839709 RepID=UPI000D68DCCE|nr:FecR domain-containing protein [Pseudomonas ovata]
MASPVERRVLEAAATWYVQFQSEPPDNAQRQAWLRWLASDPAHQVAWQQMELLQRSLGTLPGQATRQALSASGQRRQVLKLLLLLPAAGLVGWQAQDAVDNWADYRTGTGQQRRIELADGSRVDLNTDTALDIRFDARQRLMHLRSGEILVRTGKRGDQRPLRVVTQHGSIQALGTLFSVRQRSARTEVGVLEDSVRIHPEAAVDKVAVLKAGECTAFDTRTIGAVDKYQPAQVAWVEGRLIVLDARLGDVLAELGRYRHGVMRCDERAASLRVSGTFRLDALEAVLANLQASQPITVRWFTPYWVSVSYSA